MGSLPSFLIIGAARCGTSSLFSNLLKHPRLYGPELPSTRLSIEKECHFFDRKFNDPKYGIEWYKDRFKNIGADYIHFEATPNYLFIPTVPERVFQYMPRAKFIVMLRNPADRAWSHYFHWHKKSRHTTEELKNKKSVYIQKGIYWKQLERWFKFFDRKQFLIIRSEDFFANPKSIITQCFEFISVKPHDFKEKSIYYWDPIRDYLVSKRAYRNAPPGIMNWLRKFYAPHNARLEKLLDRKFDWG